MLTVTLPSSELASFARFSRLDAVRTTERPENGVKIGFVRALFQGSGVLQGLKVTQNCEEAVKIGFVHALLGVLAPDCPWAIGPRGDSMHTGTPDSPANGRPAR